MIGRLKPALGRFDVGLPGVLLRLATFAVAYVLVWALAWVVVWALVPTLLVGPRSDVQGLMQVLSVALLTVELVMLAAAALAARIALTTWGARAPAMISFDRRIVHTVVQPLIVLVACALVAALAPDSGPSSDAATSAAAVAVLATAQVALAGAVLLVAVGPQYGDPRLFPRGVAEELDRAFDAGRLDILGFRAALLGEMLAVAMTRRDSVAVESSLEGLGGFQDAYLRSAGRRGPGPEGGPAGAGAEARLVDDVSAALVAAAEQGLRAGAAPGDVDRITAALVRFADAFDEAGHEDEAIRCIDGLVALCTSPYDVPGGPADAHIEALARLISLEGRAEQRGHDRTAVHALAGWAVGATLHRDHEGAPPRGREAQAARDFGPRPPWTDAIAVVLADDWQRSWSNRLPDDPRRVVVELQRAAEEHARRHNMSVDMTPRAS